MCGLVCEGKHGEGGAAADLASHQSETKPRCMAVAGAAAVGKSEESRSRIREANGQHSIRPVRKQQYYSKQRQQRQEDSLDGRRIVVDASMMSGNGVGGGSEGAWPRQSQESTCR